MKEVGYAVTWSFSKDLREAKAWFANQNQRKEKSGSD
jgi:hypothetical protein